MLAGLALFVFPGAAWAMVLSPRAGRAALVPLAVVLSFTVLPLVAYFLNLFFRVPLQLATFAFLGATLGLAAIALRVAPPLLADHSV